MKFEKREKYIIHGERKALKAYIHQLAVDFFSQRKRILVIDTANALNPHHPTFNTVKQKLYFNHIYCIRTPMPYDLWARLGSSGSFLSKNRIGVIIITNLSLLFKDANKYESLSLAKNILKRINQLTEQHELISFIATSPSRDKTANLVYEYLSNQPQKIEVKT